MFQMVIRYLQSDRSGDQHAGKFACVGSYKTSCSAGRGSENLENRERIDDDSISELQVKCLRTVVQPENLRFRELAFS